MLMIAVTVLAFAALAVSHTEVEITKATAANIEKIPPNQGAVEKGRLPNQCAVAAIRAVGNEANQNNAEETQANGLSRTAAIDNRVIGATSGSQIKLAINE